jgi:protein-L-isoaspartate O-methyltransferase
MMIGTTLGPFIAGTLFAAAAGGDETVCRPVTDLSPRAMAGSIESMPSELAASGSLSRWTAAQGDTLRLKVRVSEPGAYEISIRLQPGAAGAAFSARAWEVPLTRDGQEKITLSGPAQDRLVDIRFDPVPLGPGHHMLDVKCLATGELPLDCVGLRRVGDGTGDIGRPSGDLDQRAFLGVQLGRPDPNGVEIVRTVPDTAAEKAGIEDGDVLFTIDGTRITTREAVQETIGTHRPGDRVELELHRDGVLIIMVVELGRRPPAEPTARTEHVVRVLEAEPGQVIADIGCGSGWLSEAIARAVGPGGTVYAVEIQERHVRELHRWSAPNIVPVLSLADDVSLPEACLDTAMLHDVASHISRSARPRFYESLTLALKPDGRLVVFGPHGKAEAMLRELRGYGYVAVDHERLAALSTEDLDRRLRDGIVFCRQ